MKHVKKMGWAAFGFFLLKGMFWLVAGYIMIK
jgi:hypothetical protein